MTCATDQGEQDKLDRAADTKARLARLLTPRPRLTGTNYRDTSLEALRRKDRNRGRNAGMVIHKLDAPHDFMLTISTPWGSADVAKCKDFEIRFQRSYRRKFKHGWAVVWLELSRYDTLHYHILAKLDTTTDTLPLAADFEQWAHHTASKLIRSTLKAFMCPRPLTEAESMRLIKVTPYDVAQLGYYHKSSKRKQRMALIVIADGRRTFTVWGMGNVKPATVTATVISDHATLELQRWGMEYLYEQAKKLGRRVNGYQEYRILSGKFTMLYVPLEAIPPHIAAHLKQNKAISALFAHDRFDLSA